MHILKKILPIKEIILLLIIIHLFFLYLGILQRQIPLILDKETFYNTFQSPDGLNQTSKRVGDILKMHVWNKRIGDSNFDVNYDIDLNQNTLKLNFFAIKNNEDAIMYRWRDSNKDGIVDMQSISLINKDGKQGYSYFDKDFTGNFDVKVNPAEEFAVYVLVDNTWYRTNEELIYYLDAYKILYDDEYVDVQYINSEWVIQH